MGNKEVMAWVGQPGGAFVGESTVAGWHKTSPYFKLSLVQGCNVYWFYCWHETSMVFTILSFIIFGFFPLAHNMTNVRCGVVSSTTSVGAGFMPARNGGSGVAATDWLAQNFKNNQMLKHRDG